ncbi:3-deoxy-D-manno-octulosonic acid transferase [Basilea psittacipulmonis]|uniref:3-deoxy-D-manno-octulosonic acid transferase n=1 Tax=Basilea psittacipulmonis DSM 24701 TaxID=1072685 RepID=A0A077DFQ0_9BURK|nr:3-deoxy-D-manno-octulosonic acid transferase [Basilea psittacipulmonis]AIL31998.1 hypothetical protein IX83_00465 [Basilea psittacipulmonis DSM 24701]
MNRFFYTQILRLSKPFLFNILKKRAKKAGGEWGIDDKRRLGHYEQLSSDEPANAGFYDPKRQELIAPVWIHAVSLGETRAAYPLIRYLLDKGYPILLTHMTATGFRQGQRFFANAIISGQLVQTWIPFDFPQAAQAFFDHWHPRCGLLIEREIWPNLLHEAKKRNIPMILVSARFSESALRSAKLLGKVMREAYGSLSLVLPQTKKDLHRLQEIGVKCPSEVVGNLKFDLQVSGMQVHYATEVKRVLNRPIVALASIRENEEALFIQEIARLKDEGVHLPLFLLIPRHAETYALCKNLLGTWSLSFVVRSEHPDDARARAADVILGDTVGEMYFYYGMSDVAIIGGSFLPYGGQNHIEACALGVPVIFGPHTENFSQSADNALFAGAARRAETVSEAIEIALDLLAHEDERKEMGKAGKDWLSLHEGATRRIVKAIESYLK